MPKHENLSTGSRFQMQFLLPARLASHQLESQRPRCDLSADSDSVSLATAGGASPVQVHSSNFSPRPSQSPTYSPEWVTLHDFSSAFQVSSCQWLWPIAKSLMSWNRGLLQVQNIGFKKQLYLGVYNHSCSCVCPFAKCDVGHATVWLEYRWIP